MKKLKYFTGTNFKRGIYHVAAYNQKQAVELISLAYSQGNSNDIFSLYMISKFYQTGHSKVLNEIKPTSIGVWESGLIARDNEEKAKQVWPLTSE